MRSSCFDTVNLSARRAIPLSESFSGRRMDMGLVMVGSTVDGRSGALTMVGVDGERE